MDVLYFFIGLALGACLAFLLARWLAKNMQVSRKQFEALQSQNQELEKLLAAKLSKEEVQAGYVPKALHELIESRLKDAEWENRQAQDELLRLTRESEKKVPRSEMDEKDRIIIELSTQLATWQQKEIELKIQSATLQQKMEELHLFSQEKFKSLASEVLEEKKKNFVDENRKELHTILDPFKTNLDLFSKKVEDTRKEDIADLTNLKKEIDLLQKLNVQLSDDAKSLATALRSEVKMQGNWGEDRLNMILEQEGLQRYIDYSREEVFQDTTADKNRRPDFIVKLPNDKHIVIDSKVSLTAYVNYFNEPDGREKNEFLKQHIRSVLDHIDTLADKNYQSLQGLNSPDYVFLFMPVESALTLAMNQHAEIFNHALRKNIVLITPTTLIATLKIIKIIWQKENQVKNVEEIFQQCGLLYDKFVAFLQEMERVDGALLAAAKAHQNAMDHLKSGTRKSNTILGRFEKIRNLEAKTTRQIPGKLLKELDLLPDDDGASEAQERPEESVAPKLGGGA